MTCDKGMLNITLPDILLSMFVGVFVITLVIHWYKDKK